jgi:hypothetical protein
MDGSAGKSPLKTPTIKSVKWSRCPPWLLRLAQLLVVAVLLAFLFRNLAANLQAIRSYNWRFDSVRSGLAVLCLTAAFGLLPFASQEALSGLGRFISYRNAYRGYFVAQLSKYLPGGLWIVPGRALVLKQLGIDMVSSSVGIIIELCLLLASGTMMSLPYFLFDKAETVSRIWALGALLIPTVLFGLHPRVFNPVLGWLMARVGYADVAVNLTSRRLMSILLIDVVFWLAAGVGFFLLVSSVRAMPLKLWLVLPSVFSMAWVVGFLAFLTPSGLGVREGALALLLAPLVPAPLPVVVALLARLWWTVAELISVLIATLLGATDSASFRP